MEHPQILGLNLKKEVIEQLKLGNYNVYDGSVGKITKFHLDYNQRAKCLLLGDTPENFHEFDIVILDLTNEEAINYNANDHIRKINKTSKSGYFECSSPQTLFDPRPCALSFLNEKIHAALANNFVLIVFCSNNEEIEYHFNGDNGHQTFAIELYSFIDDYLPYHFEKHGIQTKVKEDENELCQFLKKHNAGMSYDIAFQHPTVYQGNKPIPDPNFCPLIYNKNDEIISFCRFPTERSGIFFFPKLKEQSNFLLQFLGEIAPSIFPALFPENIKNSWTSYQHYALPNQERLSNEMLELKNEYEKRMNDKQTEIADNNKVYSFLHEMLTETDAALVRAVIKYFEWLGFINVLDGDEISTGVVKEEDIQIETEKGLLIFEVKGLGATSKDSDCSQIGKVKYRRAKQRDKFDVFASYIVNHQRHLPPLERKNPPFTAHQLEDARNEERGLLTTWQLFNLYYDVQEEIFTKEQIREAFYNFGYNDFVPKNYLKIGNADKFYQGNTIVIITIPVDVTLNIDDKILIEENGEFRQLTIKSIKVDDDFVKSATNIEVGLQLSGAAPKNGCLYKVVI